jgi:CheY-like chemotaxis protein
MAAICWTTFRVVSLGERLAVRILILLDLSMPRIDGREALAKIKGDPTVT